MELGWEGDGGLVSGAMESLDYAYILNSNLTLTTNLLFLSLTFLIYYTTPNYNQSYYQFINAQFFYI